jgi:DNA-binding GntR family transcriptional regulator
MHTSSGNKKLLHISIADILRADISRMTQNRLANLQTLSQQYHVSLVTMSKAIQVLKKQGLVAVSQGRSITVVRSSAHDDQLRVADTAITRLANQVREGIENGLYRIGQFLPKYMHYTLSDHVSSATVARAYALLDEKKIIHKSGSRWVVGPPPNSYARISIPKHGSMAAPTVLMLLPRSVQAYEELYKEHARPFMVEFLAQMARFSIRCLHVQSEAEPSPVPIFTCGRKEILALIQSCKDRYLGTLIPAQLVTFPDLKEWIEWLLQFKRPVVWFDFSDSGGTLDRSAIQRGEYYRCSSNESGLVDLALETCSRLGHRTVGFPMYHAYVHAPGGWLNVRKAHLEQVAKKRYPDLSLVFPQQDEPLWETYDSEYHSEYYPDSFNSSGCRTVIPMRGHIDALAKSLRERNQNMPEQAFKALLQQEVFASVPSLFNLAGDKDVTAILAPNQWLAINYLQWLSASGVQVPRELSLLSFDNYYNQSMFPLTVIDQGFGESGYKSAHVFINDIKIEADKRGIITTSPKLIDRGSLGLPRPRSRSVSTMMHFTGKIPSHI